MPFLFVVLLLLSGSTSHAELKVEDFKNLPTEKAAKRRDLDVEISPEESKMLMELLKTMKENSKENDKLIKELDKEM